MAMIDLRSDTVTLPSAAMRKAMAEADVGDDVYGEDPTINRLEAMAAEMLGKEAAILAPSGTQSNLLALLSHCNRGDEYIVGQNAHTYMYEGGGAAVLGGIQPQPLEFEDDGTLDLDKVRSKIKPDDFHFARSRLFCLENTIGGLVLPLDYLGQAEALAREQRLKFHLDGARVFNAAMKLQVPVAEITKRFDSISFCMSKGLGTPVGSILCGDNDLIKSARRWRKVLGGGMRQAGILAAAGIYALQNNIDRLAVDHEHAALLAQGLKEIDELEVDYKPSQTNMVFVRVADDENKPIQDFMQDKGIIIREGPRFRLVTHLDIKREDIDTVVAAFKAYFNK